MNNPAAFPRFTFGNEDLLNGITLLPMMVGMFALSEVLRYATHAEQKRIDIKERVGHIFTGMGALMRKYPKSIVRGSTLGLIVGALPGAGADIAAWMSYGDEQAFLAQNRRSSAPAMWKALWRRGAANNSALAGAWIPALVFGIPGDSITAIVIGVLYMKNMAPGPMIFTSSPVEMYAVFSVFVLANIIMLPLGYLAVKMARKVLNVPRNVLMPIILIFCIVGTFAINNSVFDVVVMLGVGLLAYLMEENDFPIAPAVLGVVLGGMLEENFVFSMIKADGDFMMFFSRPIACVLGILALLVWLFPLFRGAYRMATSARRVQA